MYYKSVFRQKQQLWKQKWLSNSSEIIVMDVNTKALKINNTNFTNERKVYSLPEPLRLIVSFPALQVHQ